MRRGVGTLTRRTALPQPNSATCVWRAEERGRGGAKKRVRPWQKYKGQKGDLETILKASNTWKYNWYKTYDSLPEELKREEIYMPYYDAPIAYNPNDPAELRRFLSRSKAASLREKNEEIWENKGVAPKVSDGDFRSYNLDQEWDDDAQEDRDAEFMDEDNSEDENMETWRQKLAPKRKAEKQAKRTAFREEMIETVRKRMIAFEKMSDADKIKKLTEIRGTVRKAYLHLKSEVEAEVSQVKTQEQAMEILKTKYKITAEKEEQLLRAMERRPTEEQKKAFEKKYKMGEFKVEGQLSGLDLYLQQKGKGRLVGFFDRLMSDAPPNIPPPIDIKVIEKKAGGKPAEEVKVEEKKAPAADKAGDDKAAGKGDKAAKGKAAKK